MNTRLQVEHTVTEMATGSTSSASRSGRAGRPLGWTQDDVRLPATRSSAA